MDASDNMGSLNHMVETVALNDNPTPESSSGQKDASPADMLRIQQQMSNQCFEMAVQLNAGKNKRSCSTSEAERGLPDYISELERVKAVHFNSTLALHRMQMWHAMGEKMKCSDPEAAALQAVSDRCMALCSRIKQLQLDQTAVYLSFIERISTEVSVKEKSCYEISREETRTLQDEITEIQKQRLEMKRLTHEKMKEMEDLTSKQEHPDTEKYKAALEKGQANLEKYKKMAVMTQNVLRGVFLACKVNWLDDPKLRDIAMTLEEFPISD